MFGEYMVYVNDKPLVIVCDDTAYVRKHAAIDIFMVDADTGHPYTGAKEHYILDIDRAAFSQQVVTALEPYVSVPKKRAKKESI